MQVDFHTPTKQSLIFQVDRCWKLAHSEHRAVWRLSVECIYFYFAVKVAGSHDHSSQEESPALHPRFKISIDGLRCWFLFSFISNRLTCSIWRWSCHHTLSHWWVPHWWGIAIDRWLHIVTEAHGVTLSTNHGMRGLHQIGTWYSNECLAGWCTCCSHHFIWGLLLDLMSWSKVWHSHCSMQCKSWVRHWLQLC